MESSEPLLTTEDVAKYLNVDVVTVRRLVSRGELAAYRIGGEYRFSIDDLRKFLEQQYVPARHHVRDARTPGLEFAKHVLQAAQVEARVFNHPHVGTEHLLLGLIQDTHGPAGKILDELGVKLEQARGAVAFLVGHCEGQPRGGDAALTTQTKKVIEYAISEARKLAHHQVGTEHLLLGLARSGEGVAAGVLEIMGVSLKQLRSAVLRAIEDDRLS